MDIKDLMLGDWVDKMPYENGSQESFQVYQLYQDDRYPFAPSHYGAAIKNSRNGSRQAVDEYEFEPIPLTDEMLLKNEFYPFEIILNDSEKKFYCINGDFYWFNDFIYYRYGDGMIDLFECKYVHELQHFINLLRVKKDFKI